MGADIHSFAEVRTTGKWVRVCALIGDSFGDDPNWYLNLSIYYHISNLLK